jgi:hypothetical protein
MAAFSVQAGFPSADSACESYDYISSYYTLAQQNNGIQMGSLYVGFDGSNNNYNHDMLARQCGQLFQDLGGSLSTGAIAEAKYSSSNQLPWLLLATWNDYGEGTNVENGVDNCWRVSAPTITSGTTTVKWGSAAVSGQSSYANADTVAYFRIWYGSGAGDLTLSENSIKASTYCTSGLTGCSFNLNNATYPPPTGSTWYIYIEQVGAAMIDNQMNGGGNGNGAPVEYTPPS